MTYSDVSDSQQLNRVSELERIEGLTSRDSAVFERITDLAASIFNVPNVGVHLLDDQRQWVKAFHGLMDTACSVEDAVCRVPMQMGEVVVFPDAQADARFDGNPVVWNEEWPIRFYAGAPLTTSMDVHIGAFCLIDAEPRETLTSAEMAVLQQFADLVSATMELRKEQRNSNDLLMRALEVDEVTNWLSERGLLRAFYRTGAQQVTRHPVAVLDAGIQQYEHLRTAYGVDVRNRLLREFASRLGNAIVSRPDVQAKSEAASTGMSATHGFRRNDGVLRAHYGDGHFVVARVFEPGTNRSEISAWVESVSDAMITVLEEPFVEEGVEIRITARVGVAIDPRGTVPPHEILDEAHHSDQRTPLSGVNQIVWEGQHARDHQRSRFSLDHQIRQGIKRDEFYLAYQPIMGLGETNHVVGFEALLRWKQADDTQIGPAVFIPAAEELGLIAQLDRIALMRAADTLSRWKQSAPHMWISVNLSPHQFTSDGFAGLGFDRIVQSGLDPKRTKIEITESAIAEGSRELEQELHRLKEMGFTLAVDDFGTGHSSLSRMIRLPFDVLKVDRAFVSDCPLGSGAAIVSSLAELAGKLSMVAVGEGVETPEQEAYLRDHGYGLAQGFMYARPFSEDRALEFIEEFGHSTDRA